MKTGKIMLIAISSTLLFFGCFQKTLNKLATMASGSSKQIVGEMKYYEADDFSVAFPGDPEHTSDIDGMSGSHYLLDHGDIAYLISIVEIAELEELDLDEKKATLIAGMEASLGDLELINKDDITSNGYPGIRFFAEGESEGSHTLQYVKLFLVEKKLVQALGLGIDIESGEGPQKFVESFQLGNFENELNKPSLSN